MKNYELLPTKTNLISTLKENLLDRNRDIKTFIDFLTYQEDGVSIAIDGNWGSGKTFFIKQTILGLSAMNPSSSMDSEIRKSICSALNINPLEENYDLTVYYDAWENDNDTDPVLSIIYEIAKQIDDLSFFNKDIHLIKTAASLLNIIKNIDLNMFGIDFNVNFDTKNKGHFTEDNLKSRFKAEKELKTTIKQFFDEAKIEQGNRLIIFIDELDRCTPTFAVRLLEQIKHYFSNEDVIFVFSINKEQLQHTIKNYYGYGFNACKYLDRFFNYDFKLQHANPQKMYYSLGLTSDVFYQEICKRIIDMFHFELRDAIHYYSQAEIIIHQQISNAAPSFPAENANAFIYCYVIPLMIGLNMYDISKYQSFINGNNPEPLIDLFNTEEVNEYLLKMALHKDEAFYPSEWVDSSKVVPKKDIIIAIYNAIFNFPSTQRELYIGSLEFTPRSRIIAEKYACIFSPAANFIQ